MENDHDLVSLSGQKIFRYTDGQKEWESPKGEESIQEISDHIETYIGEVNFVYHELLSDTVHIDVHMVFPKPDKPYYSLVTSGMSDLPMVTETGDELYLELCVALPPEWKLDQESLEDQVWYWPIQQLKMLARFPHKYDTYLGYGHTIPNGDPAIPFAENTKLNGIILLPNVMEDEGFSQLEIKDKKTIEFLSIVPLYTEEMNLKLRKGSSELIDLFIKHGFSNIIDVNRKNVAKKRFGIL
ncbi:MAG: suppressor of fused domain protein [Pseudobacteriovorax sp.]|nr:suppressor of fused domain protein [Pseudobacteriovorax sp.]